MKLKEHAKPIPDRELTALYEATLDDVHGNVTIAGLCYSTSHALERIDPTAYRCGFADWLDGQENIQEWDGEYYYADDFEAVD